jgi:hypothetical protein
MHIARTLTVLALVALIGGCASPKAASQAPASDPDKVAAERPADLPEPTQKAEGPSTDSGPGKGSEDPGGSEDGIRLSIPHLSPFWIAREVKGDLSKDFSIVLIHAPTKAMVLIGIKPFELYDGAFDEAATDILLQWAAEATAKNELPAVGKTDDGLKWMTVTGTVEDEGTVLRRVLKARQLPKQYGVTVVALGTWPEEADATVRPDYMAIIDGIIVSPPTPSEQENEQPDPAP